MVDSEAGATAGERIGALFAGRQKMRPPARTPEALYRHIFISLDVIGIAGYNPCAWALNYQFQIKGIMFKPGQSGNPAGKPRGSGRNQFCTEWALKKGLPFLALIAEGEPIVPVKEKKTGKVLRLEPASVDMRRSIAQYLIDQGIGRAPQHVSLDGDGVVKDIATAMSEALKEARQASIIPVVPPEGQQPSLPS